MALVVKDRVKETSTTTGTGTLTLAGAAVGFQSFSVIGDGNTTYYTITNGIDWEVGIGTYTASGTTLSRDTILESSNSGAAVNWGAGSKDVFVTYPAERSVTGSASALALPDPGTSGNVLTSDGTNWTSAAAGGGSSTLTIQNKTAAYTVVAGDLGTIINCTSGTFTVSLTAAATLGAGFNCWVWNTSSTNTHAIAIDPSGAETIDGLPTLILRRGEGMQIVCDGTNWQTGDKKTMRGYAENISSGGARPIASGSSSIAIFEGSIANATRSLAVGYYAQATSTNSTAVGYGAIASASGANAFGYNAYAASSNSLALGTGSSGAAAVTITGFGAMALGGSRASGTDSFAAAVANNTSSYGATGANSVAIGQQAAATNSGAVAIGGQVGVSSALASGARSLAFINATASGDDSFAWGKRVSSTPTASGARSVVFGKDCQSTQTYSYAFGADASSVIVGKYAYSAGRFSSGGDAQTGLFVLRSDTTDATPEALTSENFTASTTNQIILPNNSAYAFTGTIIARQQAAGGSNYAAWEIKGAIIRDANAASTSLGTYNINTLSATAGASTWSVALSADTTNGGLAITVTGAAATNIRWVATVQTSEVTYA